MGVIYVDSSGLLKLYVPETGSLWMLERSQSDDVVLSQLAISEVGMALTRTAPEAVLTEGQARTAWKKFRRDIRRFRIVPLSRQSLIAAAMSAARLSMPIRTLDAIQLQGAVEARERARRARAEEPLFVSADARPLAAATALGFATENPLNHP
ncbi:MAG: type II toxin-antitoxin system VapC family toxin [Dehalococcoidia bacterium]